MTFRAILKHTFFSHSTWQSSSKWKPQLVCCLLALHGVWPHRTWLAVVQIYSQVRGQGYPAHTKPCFPRPSILPGVGERAAEG